MIASPVYGPPPRNAPPPGIGTATTSKAMQKNEWKLSQDRDRPYPRMARLMRVEPLRAGFLGAGLGLALLILIVPLQVWLLNLVEPGAAETSWWSRLAEGRAFATLLWLPLAELLAGFATGFLGAHVFNLLAPTLGGLRVDLELLAEGTGHGALRRVDEEPVFEGR